MLTNKQQLRTQIRAMKKAMTAQDIASRSEALCALVLESDVYKQSQTVYGYLPFNQEVDTLPLLRRALLEGKRVALPKCEGKEMRFIYVSDLTRVQKSTIGAPEPVDDFPLAEDDTALVIVPGLAFDEAGHRIGYGGGYYDHFLSREPNHPTIALCYDFQLIPRLQPEEHDIPVQTVFCR